MKTKILYIITFLVAFLLVTGGIIYFNSNYRDIFQFDFTPVKKVINKKVKKNSKIEKISDLKGYFQNEFAHEIFDSLKVFMKNNKIDTVYKSKADNTILIDSLKALKKELAKKDVEIKKSNIDEKMSVKEAKSKSDSVYNVWVKKTSKLYESMDADRAAKIIESYSDSVARDIIYSMRQKKAAEILAQFNPATANRITRAK